MAATTKNWDHYVFHAEEIARSPGFKHLRDRILERAQLEPTDVVVDIGAGTGLLTLRLAPECLRVWALDISPAMTEYLRAKVASADYQNVDVVSANAANLPLVDSCADLVVSNYCFHHLDDDGKRRALSEVLRVLRPGGRFVFGDMMFSGQRHRRSRSPSGR